MNRQDAFSGYSPAVNFIFYISTVFLTVLIVHPAFLACSLVLSAVYYLQVRGRQGLGMISGMIPVFAAVSLINPLLNTGGDRVLFYLGQRPYTLEALYYGMALGAMFVAVILWFASYNRTMTSDKFMYVFGRRSPVISMILTMVFRMVPGFQRKARQIMTARRCIGKMDSGSSLQRKLRPSFAVVSSLTSWALEGGVITADSMVRKWKAKRLFHLFLCEAGQADDLSDGSASGAGFSGGAPGRSAGDLYAGIVCNRF